MVGADAVPKKLGSGKIIKLGEKTINGTGSVTWTVPEGTELAQILVYIEKYYYNFQSYTGGAVTINSNLTYELVGTTLTATITGHYDSPGYHYSSDWRLLPTLNAIIVE